MSFSQPFVTHRTRKDKFYTQVNTLLDWHSIEKQIKQHYKANQGEVGRDGLLRFVVIQNASLGHMEWA